MSIVKNKQRTIFNLGEDLWVEAKSLRKGDRVTISKRLHIVERAKVHETFTYVHYREVGLKYHHNAQLINLVK